MMKAVGKALGTSYEGKKWLKWFETTAKAVIAELDGASTTDAVRLSVLVFVRMYACSTLLRVLVS